MTPNGIEIDIDPDPSSMPGNSYGNVVIEPNLSMEMLTELGGLSKSEIENTIRTLKCMSKLSNKYPIKAETDGDYSLNDILLPLRSLLKKVFHTTRGQTRNQRRKMLRMIAKRKEGGVVQKPLNAGIRKLRAENARKLHEAYNNHSTQGITSLVPVVVQAKIGPKQRCYICKTKFCTSTGNHHFYDQLCKKCGKLNFARREQTADLTGKVALVTGGRIKIGFRVCLHLLRCGATLIVTTRFPKDARTRFAAEPDFETWKGALNIYGLDLRFLQDIEMFCAHICQTFSRLDILIQNACQTIRRPVQFYQHLIDKEAEPSSYPQMRSWDTNCPPLELTSDFKEAICNITAVPKSVQASQLVVHPEDKPSENNDFLFPEAVYDQDHQQLDLREKNSWVLETDQVETAELVEVNLINAIAPFILLNKLTPLLKAATKNGEGDNYGWIILVSAMEGKFNRFKTSRHPHTNCAKASLNMLVRTSASYYESFKLLLNAVDTGWVTDEDPIMVRMERQRSSEFHPPLDEFDGAMRILDPIFQTINENKTECGVFYKDYKPSEW